METTTINKNRNKKGITALKVGGGPRQKNVRQKTIGRDLVPGKTIEQIQIEAVRRLRELGIFI